MRDWGVIRKCTPTEIEEKKRFLQTQLGVKLFFHSKSIIPLQPSYRYDLPASNTVTILQNRLTMFQLSLQTDFCM